MIDAAIAAVMPICCGSDVRWQRHLGNDLSNDVMARQNAAICVNDKSLFPDVVYHTTAWWLLVFHITGDLTVTLKFGPVVDMTKRTVNVVTPLLPLGKWGAVNN